MLSPLDMFQIGIGSSSSHTVGPMKIALKFVKSLADKKILLHVVMVKVELFGSLALTGEGHATLNAVVSGLAGQNPHDIKTEDFLSIYTTAIKSKKLKLLDEKLINFDPLQDIILEKNIFLKEHPNAMRINAYDKDQSILYSQDYFSVGGGFIIEKGEAPWQTTEIQIPFPFETAAELFQLCEKNNLMISELVIKNELANKSIEQLEQAVLEIANRMSESVENGINSKIKILPGGINVHRRAPEMYRKLNKDGLENNIASQRLLAMAFAMAVNEENAAFGKVVTAPTNGSAGTIPGVLEYYKRFYKDADKDKVISFILTAGAIGTLYKIGASISAAEVGCQGEIGVSCSMATAALTAVLGGNVKQVMRAAEIAMEHSLGMTCDPVKGLVQVPCIERNGVAASRAIDIAGMALLEDGDGIISLDAVIQTMLSTGLDMNSHYKETALGGLAVNHINC